jgi:hypothetical protein
MWRFCPDVDTPGSVLLKSGPHPETGPAPFCLAIKKQVFRASRLPRSFVYLLPCREADGLSCKALRKEGEEIGVRPTHQRARISRSTSHSFRILAI